MTFRPRGLPEPRAESSGNTTAGVERAMSLALAHQIAERLGISEPVKAAELTAIRSAVEDHFENATAGVTADDVAGGWTAEELLEQHGLRVAMDMMLEGLKTPKSTPGNDWQCPP